MSNINPDWQMIKTPRDIIRATVTNHKSENANVPCYCGSTKKYKACHQRFEYLPPKPEEMILSIRNEKPKSGKCMHHKAPNGCENQGAISSHSVSRSSTLKPIAEKGEVYQFLNDSEFGGETNIGIKKASTFFGFCHNHDALFSPIDNLDISNPLLPAIIGYRSYCHGIYTKNKAVKTYRKMRDLSICGMCFDEAKERFVNFNTLIESMKEGILVLKRHHKDYIEAIDSNSPSKVKSTLLHVDGFPCMAASSSYTPDHSLDGKRHIDALAPIEEIEALCLDVIPTKDGHYICISTSSSESWIHDIKDQITQIVLTSPDDILGYCAHYIENVYYRPSWITGLSENDYIKLCQASCDPAPWDTPFPKGEFKLLGWSNGQILHEQR